MPTPLRPPKGASVHSSLSLLGWDDGHAQAFAPYAETHRPARVARVDRGAADVLTAESVDSAAVTWSPERALVDHRTAVAVGDWVALADGPAGLSVDVVLGRRSVLGRAVASGRSEEQVLAANLDTVLVTVPTTPEPKPGLIERLVALGWDSGAAPVVVVTKADLSPDPEGVAADAAAAAPGVEVVLVSVVAPGGLDPLRPHLAPGRTLCLVGKSGAGKSSLVNALLSADVLETQETRRDGKGRHTTTHRQLVPLPGGALLLDTPGIRGAGLAVTDTAVDQTFPEVEALVEECRFSDCAHRTEPGCAVLAALDDGTLSERRFDSWQRLQREAAWMARRTDARLRAEYARSIRLRNEEMRRAGRIRH
jgi:ribosome biogenesis GTPase